MTISLSKDSLHYRLASVYGGIREWEDPKTNLCTYTKNVLYGSIIAFMLTIIIGGLLGSIVDALLWVSIGFLYSFVEISITGFVGTLVVGVLGLSAILVNTVKYIVDFFPKVKKRKQPSYLRLLYSSFKEKVCFIVVLDDHKNDK